MELEVLFWRDIEKEDNPLRRDMNFTKYSIRPPIHSAYVPRPPLDNLNHR